MQLSKEILDQKAFNDKINKNARQNAVLAQLENLKQAGLTSYELASLIPLYLIDDLYSDSSSNNANTSRISTNIDIAAEQLLAISRHIKDAAN